MPNEKKIIELDINDVLPNRFQPRIKFDEKALNELALSIKKYGVINPIVVRKIGSKYEIIAGERRYKASVLAGKITIPAIVSDFSDNDSVEIALIENVQREDLTPIEKAISYKKILDMDYMSQEDLAKKIGKSQSSIANTMRLLGLSDEVQEAILDNKISERHARSLLKIKNHHDQVIMLNKIISERLTVRKTDEEIDNMLNNDVHNIDEIINIPDDTIETNNPGFMNIDKIEKEAKDIIIPEKPTVDLNRLMTKDENMSDSLNEDLNDSDILIPGKFFNFFNDEKDNSDIQTNDIPKMETTPSIEPMYDIPKVEPTLSIEPMYDIPKVEPTLSIEPMYDIPKMETTPSIEPMYDIPKMETTPSIEPMYDIPKVETTPSIEPMYDIPKMETTPSIEPMYDIPKMETIPSIEPMYDIPKVETTPSIEPMYDIPKVETTPSIEPMYDIPKVETTPSIEPMYDIPKVEPTPSIEPMYDIPKVETINENINNKIFATNNIKMAINTIRDCTKTLEKYGFDVDVEEVDFEDIYQVIFKIKK